MKKSVKRITALALVLTLTISLVSLGISDVVENECLIPEHQHSDECYLLPDTWELTCGVGGHSHTDSCYDENFNLVCGYSDKIIHTHDERCYDDNGELVCNLPEYQEHTHTEDCYAEERVLVCEEETLPETPHEHTAECYEIQDQCVCGQEADEAHVHTEECFRILVCGNRDPGAQEHVHTDSCYETSRILICGQDELAPHTHSEACYGANGELICGMLETVDHQHDDSCFTIIPGGKSETPLCGMEEHTHSDACRTDPDADSPADEPVIDDEPMIDDAPVESPDFSIDNATGSEEAVSAQYCVTVQRIMSRSDTSSKTCTIQQTSGDSVVMPAAASLVIADSTQVAFDPITFLSAGEYTFRIDFSDLEEYYILSVNAINDAGVLRLSATYTQMPDGTVNETGAIFYDQVVEFLPTINRVVTGGNPESEASYKIENLDAKNQNVVMPAQTTIHMNAAGTEAFPAVKFYCPGIFNFSISEIDPATGDALDVSSTWYVTVTVVEQNGELQASCVYWSDADGSRNTSCALFVESQVQFVPTANNVFVGQSGSTQFSISAKTASPYVQVPEGSYSFEEGEGQLPPIVFRKAGAYDFLIQDVSVGEGYKRDTRTHTLTVTVTSNGNELHAEGHYAVSGGIENDSSAMFINVESRAYGWSSTTEMKANRLMSQMSLEEKVGQLFLLHYSDSAARTAEEVKRITDTYHPGGYIVFQTDLKSETPASFKEKIDQTQKDSKIPLIISIDEEGGTVNR